MPASVKLNTCPGCSQEWAFEGLCGMCRMIEADGGYIGEPPTGGFMPKRDEIVLTVLVGSEGRLAPT